MNVWRAEDMATSNEDNSESYREILKLHQECLQVLIEKEDFNSRIKIDRT